MCTLVETCLRLSSLLSKHLSHEGPGSVKRKDVLQPRRSGRLTNVLAELYNASLYCELTTLSA